MPTLLGLELVVILGAAVLICAVAGPRLRVAPPVLLLAIGILLGFAPVLRGAHLPPEVVLLLFLPALLYWESLTTSLREIRSNLRVIVMTSTLLVIFTAWGAAAVAHTIGLPWGPSWVLGAAIAPTDATAVSVLARALPRRTLTVLRTESLVNDGTALVIYAVAVAITRGSQRFSVSYISWLFVLAYAGGALAGLLTAWIGIRVRRHLQDPLQANLAVILIPFTAFLLAQAVHASGVLAVVTAGLVMSQASPRIDQPVTRQQTQAFWSLATYLLNGVLFVLVGLEAQAAVRGLDGTLTRGLIDVGAVSAAVIAARFAWLFTTPYILRAIDRRPQQRERRVGARGRVVSATSGFRGAVSLAAALAVPETVSSSAPFPNRDLIVFVTTGVIVVTLAVQGLLLPSVIRWARLPTDNSVDQEHHFAQITASEEALEALPQLAADLGTDLDIAARMRKEFEKHLRVLHAGDDGADDEPALHYDQQYTELRLAVLARKRATVVRLRDERRIDDMVLRRLQAGLDSEEVRLTRRQLVD